MVYEEVMADPESELCRRSRIGMRIGYGRQRKWQDNFSLVVARTLVLPEILPVTTVDW